MNWVCKMALQLYSVLPSSPTPKGFAQNMFSVFFEQWFGEYLSQKEIKSGSTQYLMLTSMSLDHPEP